MAHRSPHNKVQQHLENKLFLYPKAMADNFLKTCSEAKDLTEHI